MIRFVSAKVLQHVKKAFVNSSEGRADLVEHLPNKNEALGSNSIAT